MLRTCKYCGKHFKAYAKLSRVCDPCKEKNIIEGQKKSRDKKLQGEGKPFTLINKLDKNKMWAKAPR